jgi:hypothetical protein
MAKKKIEKDMEDLDLRLARAWRSFKTKVTEFVNSVEECTVQLHFESSLDARTHFKFDPDEAVFISDIQVSHNNQVIFMVPYGAKNKSFLFVESELINTKTGKEVEPLNTVLQRFYGEAFADVPEASSITVLERKYLATNPELRDLFNNVEDALKLHELNIERGKVYGKLDNFGMF